MTTPVQRREQREETIQQLAEEFYLVDVNESPRYVTIPRAWIIQGLRQAYIKGVLYERGNPTVKTEGGFPWVGKPV